MLDWEEIITWMDTATGPTALPSQTHYRSWNCIVSSGELGPNQERAGEIQWAGNQSGISGSNHAVWGRSGHHHHFDMDAIRL